MKSPQSSNPAKHFFMASLCSFVMAGIFYEFVNAGTSALYAGIAGIILLSLAMQQHRLLRDFTFTLWILVGVSLAMSFPDDTLLFMGFDSRQLIIPLLIFIMFGMGCTISAADFVNVLKMPKAVFIGVACQFTLMPALGFCLAMISGLAPEIAAGIILVGCSPSGLASNVMSFISGANVALSLTLTTVSTLLAPLITPLLMTLLADQFIEINPAAMFFNMVKIVFLPIIFGLLVNHFFQSKIMILNRVMPLLSMVGIVIIIAIICAAGRDSILSIGGVLVLIIAIHNLLGFALGYSTAKLLGLNEQDARTVCFEVGMQNSGLASGIALTMNKIATMGLAPAFFSPFMNITGSSLAAWWRKKKHDNTAK